MDDRAGTSDGRATVAFGWWSPLNRDGMALVLSSGLSAVVGLLYWVVAARLFDPETVGVNSTLISTLTLLGSAAQLNLGSAMLRFVPVAGHRAPSLVAASYAIGAMVACVVGTVFGLGAGWWAPQLRDALGPWVIIVFFALATPLWSIFVMQDYVLTSIKRATIVPVENLTFALMKVGLLVVGSWLGWYAGIALSWVTATFVVVLAISGWLAWTLPTRDANPATVPITPGMVARFVSADFAGTLFSLAGYFGLQLVVLARLGPDAAATYGIVWAIAYSLYLVSNGMGQSMVAHLSANPGSLVEARRNMIRKATMITLPAAAIAAVAAWPILSIFGPHYAETGAVLLALTVFSAVPNVIVLATISTARVQQQRSVLVGVPALIACTVIPLSWILMPSLGVAGVGVAWLVGQSAVAAGILLRGAAVAAPAEAG